jgi:hypothetical protein
MNEKHSFGEGEPEVPPCRLELEEPTTGILRGGMNQYDHFITTFNHNVYSLT